MRVPFDLNLLLRVVYGLRSRNRLLGAPSKSEKPGDECDQETVGKGEVAKTVHNGDNPYFVKSVDYSLYTKPENCFKFLLF